MKADGSLSQELREVLSASARRHGLETSVAELQERARLSLLGTLGDGSRIDRLGASRLGGVPDLPLGAEWPSVEGRRMQFVAQIDLAELPPSLLPRKGLVSFFVDDHAGAVDVSHRVVYTLDGELARLQAPDADDDPAFVFDVAPIVFAPAVSLPDPFAFENENDAFYDRLQSLRSELLPDDRTRMLGYPEVIGSDPRVDAYLCATGHKDILYTHGKSIEEHDAAIAKAWEDSDEDAGKRALALEAQRESLVWFRNDHAGHQVEIEAWEVLLQVASHRSLGMNWWDSGLLAFLADTPGLRRGDMWHTYATIQSS